MAKRLFRMAIFTAIALASALAAPNLHASSEDAELTMDTPGAIYFKPPVGWFKVDDASLPTNVIASVVGESKGGFRPFINLALEPFQGTLRDYLKIVKSINASKGQDWKDLGKIKTAAGIGSLSQLDKKSAEGEVRMLHTILAKDGMIYILTAAAAKNEFPSYYKHFFEAMSSFQINDVK